MNDKLKRIYIPMTETGFYILYCLQEENHGYNIGLQVKQMTGGELTISPGTMYGTLSKMEQEADTTLFGDRESKLELCKRVVHGQFLRMLPFILLFPSILNLWRIANPIEIGGPAFGTFLSILCGLSLGVFIIPLVIYLNQINRLNKLIKELERTK